MTKYASSDIHSHVNAGCPTGGHLRKVTNQREVNKGAEPIWEMDPVWGDHMVVNCAACEPQLTAKDSWSDDPFNIPMTQAERAEADRLEKEGMKHSALMAEALAELAREKLATR